MRTLKNLYHLVMAVLANLRYGFPARKLRVVGVTGTDGKTTTCHLIYEIMRSSGLRTGLISTVEARIDDKVFDTGFHVTSPSSWQLQRLLAQMVREGEKFVVLEVTSHGLDQSRFLGVPFEVGVVTNITHDHLDYHQTYENYLEAKSKLFRQAKLSVLNADDSSFEYLKSVAGGRVESYSRGNQQVLKLAEDNLTLLGEYNISNAMAAVVAVTGLGVGVGQIVGGLRSFKPLPGRFEKIDEGQDFTVIVDFAHTPNSLEKMLQLCRSLVSKDNKVIVVFGCAGLRDVEKRPEMGRIAIELADKSVFTAEDPRTENVNAIIEQMVVGAKLAGGVENQKYFLRPDRREAIEFALKTLASPGDLVVITGKGHERSMCFGTVEQPWSDQEVTRSSLRKVKGQK